MSWVKIDDQLHTHEKFLECSLAARGLWLMCVSWVGDKETDGVIPLSVVRLHGGPESAAMIAELTAAELWVPCGDGKSFIFKNYLKYNKSHAELEAERGQTAIRQQRFRDSKRHQSSDSSDSNAVTPAVTNAATNGAVTPAPVSRIPNPDIKSLHTVTGSGLGGQEGCGEDGEPILPPPPAQSRSPSNAPKSERQKNRQAFVENALERFPHWRPELEKRLTDADPQDPLAYSVKVVQGWFDGDGTPTKPNAKGSNGNGRREQKRASERRGDSGAMASAARPPVGDASGKRPDTDADANGNGTQPARRQESAAVIAQRQADERRRRIESSAAPPDASGT